MRPLELRLRNFRSYFTPKDSPVTFDFRDRRLIGIVGPIGSGKSTLLDAIAFALYGRTPRIARSTRSLIHQRADGAAVSLRFEVDGEIWEAVRSIRAKGGSQHALYRYADDTVDDEPVEKLVQEAEVNARIAELLGFDFDAFGRSVLLAQGQFAEFLTARPAERDKVLKGVFGHERIDAMRELAKLRVREGEFEIDKLQLRLQNAEQAMARLAQRRVEYGEAEERVALLDKHVDRVTDLTERQLAAARAATTAGDRLEELRQQADRLPDSDKTDELLAMAVHARAERTRLAAELEAAHAQLSKAEAAVRSPEHEDAQGRLRAAQAAMSDRRVRDKALEVTQQQHAAAAARYAAAEGTTAEADARVIGAEAAATAAEKRAAAARSRLEAAMSTLHAAQHADMASTLREGLTTGADCPVCRQPVAAVPDIPVSSKVADAQAAADLAIESREAADAELAAAAAELAAARAAAADAARRVDETVAELADADRLVAVAIGELEQIDAVLADTLGAGDATELIGTLADEITAVDAAQDAARRTLEETRRVLDAAIGREQESDRALGDLRTQLGALATVLAADAELPEDDPDALRAGLAALRERWSAATQELRSNVETAQAEATALAATLTELFSELGIDGSFEAARAEAEAAVAILGTTIQDDEELVAGAQDLIDARQSQVAKVDDLRRIATDLTDAKFIRYLLDEERAALAELGSDHFQRLSSGRYRFTDDGTFEVVDLTTAEAIRKADSLSGGETFLASLGLALGLAEMVSRTGGRLDAFFLDEGFGSLDHEHLDLAMDGIEQLVADGTNRLVVVVSHVPEMRQRLEDLIVLDRDPITGDSIVMAGATSHSPPA